MRDGVSAQLSVCVESSGQQRTEQGKQFWLLTLKERVRL